MSYILDALNKSEKERTKKQAPGIATLQDEEPASGFTLKHWLMLLAVLVLVNSIGAYLFLGDRAAPAKPPPTFEKPSATTKIEPAPVAAIPIPLAPPELSITSHIFADDPSLRMVKINGIDRREGDLIGPEHRLIQITETGVVLRYGREEYVLNVVEDWQNEL